MRYLKYFEDVNHPTLREKLESIVSMYNYLCDNDMGDSLNNFVGACSVLFIGNLEVNSGWSFGSKVRPYTFDIGGFLSSLESAYRKDEKLARVEELYTLSKYERFDKTKKDIEGILKPFLETEMFGGRLIEKYKIEQYYNDWLKKPCFGVKLYLDGDLLPFSKDEVIPDSDIEDMKNECLHIVRILKIEMDKITDVLSKNNLLYEFYENTYFNKFHEVHLRLKPIK